MTREDIYSAIDNERNFQDRNWPRDLGTNPQRAQYKFYAPHLILLEEKLAKMRTSWYGADKEALHSDLIKIATIAVRALEEVEVAK